jgi:hypothetical protein
MLQEAVHYSCELDHPNPTLHVVSNGEVGLSEDCPSAPYRCSIQSRAQCYSGVAEPLVAIMVVHQGLWYLGKRKKFFNMETGKVECAFCKTWEGMRK